MISKILLIKYFVSRGSSEGCPKHISLGGFRALLKAIPKEEGESKTIESAVIYVAVRGGITKLTSKLMFFKNS